MAVKAKNKPVLRLLEGGYGTVQPDPRCQIAAKAVMAGPQDYRVYGGNAQATGRGHGVITIRVGRVLIYLEDREALLSWTRAIEKAKELDKGAFGPEIPELAYKGR